MSRWDEGIEWSVDVVEPPTDLVVSSWYVSQKVLRVANDGYDSDLVDELILAATAAAEEATGRAIAPQRLRQVMSGFPCGGVVLQRPPLIAVRSVNYIDTDGVEQSMAVSPAMVHVVPSTQRTKAEVWPLHGQSWPVTSKRPDAVTIEYDAGFSVGAADAELALIKRGICMMVAELYRIPELSVQGANTSVPSVLGLDRFWRPVMP